MANPSVTYTFSNSTTSDATEVNTNFTDLISSLTDGTKTLTISALVAASVNTEAITLGSGDINLESAIPPIGSIIPFYDFNAALTFSTTYWKYCDGTSQTVGGVSRTLPDLSGRYLVGFGDDGDGLIGTAAWATAAVGNAGSEIDLSHTHTVDGHTHSISSDGAHTHTGPSHSHALTAAYALVEINSGGKLYLKEATITGWTSNVHATSVGRSVASEAATAGTSLQGSTDAGGTGSTSSNGAHTHTGATGSATPATDSQLSATTDIRPISIRVRFIMRVK